MRYRLSAAAQADVVDVLAWTQERHGNAARQRYERLIAAALRDVAAQPERPGSIARPELGAGVRSWHLRLSRSRAGAPTVVHPRHWLIYRVEPDVLIVGRLLHDAMALARYRDDADAAEAPG